jgi:hypothetical protein
MVHIGVAQAIGAAEVGADLAGATDEAMPAVTGTAMLEDTPVAVNFMAAEASIVKADSTVVETLTAEPNSTGEVASTVAADTGADAGNRVERNENQNGWEHLAASRFSWASPGSPSERSSNAAFL